MRGWERQKEIATDRERIKTPQERPGIEWKPTYGSVNGMLWPPQLLQWLSDNKIRSKWQSMSRYVSIRRKVKQWGWKTKTSTVNSSEDRMQNLPLQQSHLKVNMKRPSQPILLSYAMHFIVYFWIFSKIKVGQGLIFFRVELTGSWKYEEETWRLKFKVTLHQSNSIYPNGSATFACTAHSCIFYPKHLTMFNQFTHSLGMELMNLVLHYACCLFKTSLLSLSLLR